MFEMFYVCICNFFYLFIGVTIIKKHLLIWLWILWSVTFTDETQMPLWDVLITCPEILLYSA